MPKRNVIQVKSRLSLSTLSPSVNNRGLALREATQSRNTHTHTHTQARSHAHIHFHSHRCAGCLGNDFYPPLLAFPQKCIYDENIHDGLKKKMRKLRFKTSDLWWYFYFLSPHGTNEVQMFFVLFFGSTSSLPLCTSLFFRSFCSHFNMVPHQNLWL